MPHNAWRNWYHCTAGTYGTWLPGDPRGWRERHHHEHVDGDYKRPPHPTAFATGRHARSKALMRSDRYFIPPHQRQQVGQLLLESFQAQETAVLAMAVCRTNFHVLLQCVDGNVKPRLGAAKRHVTFSIAPIMPDGSNRRVRMWEGGCGVKPIADKARGLNVLRYILNHVNEGGWIWSFRDKLVKD